MSVKPVEIWRVVFFYKAGGSVSVLVGKSQIRRLKTLLSSCFYDERGNKRPTPLGEVGIANNSGVWLFRAPAKDLKPVIQTSKV
jgi:hypothetical protein